MISLPRVVSDYLTAADRGDLDAVVACFADDAVVADENRQWRGRDGIRQWRETVATAYAYTTDVRGATALGLSGGADRYDVQVHLEGNFPGATVDLTNRFGVRDGRIVTLEIVPAR
jgi:ketosteroid isomerase-like protein